jgi:hypothetical protein
MNVRLMRVVQRRILARPKNFDMSLFAHGIYDDDGELCGTTACIGGEALLAAGAKLIRHPLFIHGMSFLYTSALRRRHPGLPVCGGVDRVYPERAAAKLLGLTYEEAARLFFQSQWPEKYCYAYEDARGPRGRARVAARRIDHFITTAGRE